jgi:hypothetical protein
MTFEEELKALIDSGLPHDELVAAVTELHVKHGREVPPPLTGAVAAAEPEDAFGRRRHG